MVVQSRQLAVWGLIKQHIIKNIHGISNCSPHCQQQNKREGDHVHNFLCNLPLLTKETSIRSIFSKVLPDAMNSSQGTEPLIPRQVRVKVRELENKNMSHLRDITHSASVCHHKASIAIK